MESWMWCFLLSSHFLILYFSPSHSLCHPHDSFALLHFKNSFTINTSYYDEYYPFSPGKCDSGYSKTRTGENGRDCCSWHEVTCHPISGHVTELDLTCAGLVGEIHPNSTLFHLSHLHSLNLAFNDFYPSQLSSLFGGFVSLTHLNLSHSYFEGDIPSQISHLTKLVSLDLSGYYPSLKWKEETWKRLLQNATVLRVIVLDGTDMSSISIRTLNMSFSLVTLSLRRTGPSGKLTDGILCLPNLQRLDLSDNNLNGSIPPSFSNLTHLTSLDLSSNYLNGSIPSSLLTLPRLTLLNLEDNFLSGQIPNVFPQSNRFRELHLSGNKIEGDLPSTLSNLQHLIHLDLSYNKFSGQIPDVFFGLNKLNTLYLGRNSFGGTIPSSIFGLTQLYDLDCSDNKLEGPLPNNISGFSNLTSLWLDGNLLNGTIPSWCLSWPSLVSLYLSKKILRAY